MLRNYEGPEIGSGTQVFSVMMALVMNRAGHQGQEHSGRLRLLPFVGDRHAPFILLRPRTGGGLKD